MPLSSMIDYLFTYLCIIYSILSSIIQQLLVWQLSMPVQHTEGVLSVYLLLSHNSMVLFICKTDK